MPHVPAHVMPAFFSFQQVREDLARHTTGMTAGQLWLQVAGRHSLGYHLKHIAGSVDRLTTYLTGQPLSPGQLEFLRNEHSPDAGLADLLALVDTTLHAAEQQLLQVKPESLSDVRAVGRQHLPTTVLGLIVHVCEHTQRHLGQAILISRLLRG
jgi:uncharacterized damage-inducible protein DinB